jgi:hypothetical protein
MSRDYLIRLRDMFAASADQAPLHEWQRQLQANLTIPETGSP